MRAHAHAHSQTHTAGGETILQSRGIWSQGRGTVHVASSSNHLLPPSVIWNYLSFLFLSFSSSLLHFLFLFLLLLRFLLLPPPPLSTPSPPPLVSPPAGKKETQFVSLNLWWPVSLGHTRRRTPRCKSSLGHVTWFLLRSYGVVDTKQGVRKSWNLLFINVFISLIFSSTPSLLPSWIFFILVLLLQWWSSDLCLCLLPPLHTPHILGSAPPLPPPQVD